MVRARSGFFQVGGVFKYSPSHFSKSVEDPFKLCGDLFKRDPKKNRLFSIFVHLKSACSGALLSEIEIVISPQFVGFSARKSPFQGGRLPRGSKLVVVLGWSLQLPRSTQRRLIIARECGAAQTNVPEDA